MEHELTSQQIFDHVLSHMRKQKVVSANEHGDCLYKGPNDTSCAVGCLITDEDQVLEEDTSLQNLIKLELLPTRLIPHQDLLENLQEAHDETMPNAREFSMELWEERMGEIANMYSLSYSSPTLGC